MAARPERPIATREEPPMTGAKVFARYARYALVSLAAVAFGRGFN